MAGLKTKPNDKDVQAFLQEIEPDARREDCLAIMQLMQEVTGETPRMWGNSIVGFGTYHFTYASGREGDWFLTGFSPRKRDLSLYIMAGFDHFPELMDKLGRHKHGKSCLYLKKLDDVDKEVLRELIQASVDHLRAKYPKGTV